MDLASIQDLFVDKIANWFDLPVENAQIMGAFSSTFLIVLLALIVDRAMYLLIGWSVPRIVKRLGSQTPAEWEESLARQLVSQRSAHIIACLIVYWLIPYALKDFDTVLLVIRNIIEGYLVIISVLTLNSFLRASKDVYDENDTKGGLPIRFATQALQSLVWIIGGILAVAVTFDQSVSVLLGSLAGMTAILALVFRDTILGFVAGIQLSSNEMLRTGDWIEMPDSQANGTVEEIGLTTIKVRNFDKTISTLPSYSLVSGSFKNWRGMKDTQVRRIKRSIRLDMDYIRTMSQQEWDDVLHHPKLEEFWTRTTSQVSHESLPEDLPEPPTNLSLFGDYARFYLSTHPNLSHNKTTMVRQLEPDSLGLPIEIYCFCSDTDWIRYENVQWKIIDHLLSMLPCFGLRAFQLSCLNGVEDER